VIFLDLGILLVIGAGTWWLTGIDNTVGGESKRDHHLTRALRCVGVVFLSAIFIGTLGQSGFGVIPVLIIVPLSIAIILRSSLAELGTHGFLGLVDPALYDHRAQDPHKVQRHQDAIAHLIHNGHRDAAIKLCEELKQSGEVDAVTLDHTLAFLGVKMADHKPAKPLAEAAHLREQGNFTQAETLLQSLLRKNPADDGAAMLLMRLYAQDLRQPSRAHAVLRALQEQPHVPASHLEFARRSIEEWSRPQPVAPKTTPLPQPLSVDDLLAQGSLGRVVELLELQIKARPDDFALQFKLAEVHAVHCKDLRRAEQIIGRLEQRSNASPEQIARARARLAEWRTGRERLQG